MPATEKKFGFDSPSGEIENRETWAFTGGGATGIGSEWEFRGSSDSPNDPGANGGTLVVFRSGKSLTNGAPYWEWLGTLEELGVPKGATVTAINLSFDWKCWEYNTGAASTVGPSELRDEAGTLLKTFAASSAYSATSVWATKAGANQTGLALKASEKVRLRVNAVPKTGNSSSAFNKLGLDWVVVTVTYEEAGKTVTKELADTVLVGDALSKSGRKALADTATTADAIAKQPGKALADGVAPADAVAKQPQKALADGAVTVDAIGKQPQKVLADGVTTTDAVAKGALKALADGVTVVDAIIKGALKVLADVQALADAFVKQPIKELADTALASDEVAKRPVKALADAQGLEDGLAFGVSKRLADTVLAVDGFSKSARKRLADTVTVLDHIKFPQFVGTFIRYLGKWVKVV